MKDLLHTFRFDATGDALLPSSQGDRLALDDAFASLPPDKYLRTSRRQTGLITARYTCTPKGDWERELLSQEPYVQRSDMSPVGRMPREYPLYDGILEDTADNVFRGAVDMFPDFFPQTIYTVDMFAFRITGEHGQPGSPAVEGGHFDGDDRNLLFVVSRQNVGSTTGETTLFQKGQQDTPYFRRTLQSGDLITWEDRSPSGLWHNTTPITPENPTKPAVRHVFDFGINPDPIKNY